MHDRISNARRFREPVYDGAGDVPHREAISSPVSYAAGPVRAEQIRLEAAPRRRVTIGSVSREALEGTQRRYFRARAKSNPRVFYESTVNWRELRVRFVGRDHNVRGFKDALSRDILAALDGADTRIGPATP